MSLKPALALLLATSSTLAFPQSTKSLAEYIKSLNWDSAKSGTLVAIGAETTRAKLPATDLGAFQRKQFKFGEVTAFAPGEMVVIDDSFRQQPDFSDGLPRDMKVLYLLKTLSPDQWTKITKGGIGLSDLQGEQKAVFNSLLPKKLAWTELKFRANGFDVDQLHKDELPQQQLSKVKLRLVREVRFYVELVGTNGYTVHDLSRYHVGGSTSYERDNRDEMDVSSVFGVQARATLPNKPKTSQLVYTEFAKVVPVKNGTLREVLASIGRATGKEIYPDLRVSDLKVSISGESARAGELLQALAMCVTGTYRKVGTAYVLTSDVIGLGARKAQYAIWSEDLMRRSYAQAEEWRRAIGSDVSRVAMDSDGPLELNDAMKKRLEKEDSYPSQDWMPAHEASESVRRLLAQINRQYSHQPIKTEKFRPASQIGYAFVLPDGKKLDPEISSLGEAWSFNPKPPERPVRTEQPPKLPVAVSQDGPGFPLVVATESVSIAKGLLAEARSRGFKELWIETRNAEALKAVIEEGKAVDMQIQLVIRPFLATTKSEDLDRTVLGDTNSALAKRLSQLTSWNDFTKRSRSALPGTENIITPLDPAIPSVFAQLVALGKTPGLKGVILGETGAVGYEPEITRWSSGDYSKTLENVRSFGYSTEMRLGFLRSNGIDPIDIVDEDLITGPDLRQPFFLDDGLRGVPSVYDGRDNPHPALSGIHQKWTQFRYKLNQKAVLSLMESIAPHVPVMVNLRPSSSSYPGSPFETFVPWKPGDDLALLPAESPWGAANPPDAVFVHVLPDWPLQAGDYRPYTISRLLSQGGVRSALDVRRVPIASLVSTLDHFTTRR